MKEELNNNWPALPLAEWQDTYLSLHLYTQIVGKIKLALTPPINHWWNTALYLSSSGFTTGTIPYRERFFQIDFDFIQHKMFIRMDDGLTESIDLATRSVADFYKETMGKLKGLGIDIKIWTQPVEMPYTTHFEKDTPVRPYKAEYATNFWKILLLTDGVTRQFKSRFYGKASPVHFFWGSFDLAHTFFSGRLAPEHAGSLQESAMVAREAYNRELCSFGFWPGDGLGEPAYYAYAYPEPENYKNQPIKPKAAYYDPDFKEYILPYDAVRKSTDPSGDLFSFIESTFEAAYTLQNWDEHLYKK